MRWHGKSEGTRCLGLLRVFDDTGYHIPASIRVLYRAPSKNLVTIMVARFFFAFSWKKRDSPLAVFWGIFGQSRGFLLQKCCKFFRSSIRCATRVCGIFADITCCKFLETTPSEMLHALSRWFVFPCFDDHNACKHARSYPQYCGQQDTAPL